MAGTWQDLITHLGNFALVLMRVSILVLFFPVWDSRLVPVQIKVAGVLTLAVALTPVVQASLPPFPSTLGAGLLMFLKEMLLGLSIFLVLHFVFAGLQMAGELVGIQIGFGMVTMIDPQAEGQASLLASLIYWLALLVFLAVGGHHFLFRFLVESFQVVPLGWLLPDNSSLPQFIVSLSGTLFAVGVKLLAPILVVIFLIQVSLGLVARTVTQIQVMLISFPLTIALGVFFLGVSLPLLLPLLEGQFQGMAVSLERVLRLLQG